MQEVHRIDLTGKNSTERMKEITGRLEAGLRTLFDSEQYKNYLTVMSKFHSYSPNNTMLIAMQMPDASFVAGYDAWKKNFDRHVKAKEQGIKIIAPYTRKTKKNVPIVDPVTQNPMVGADGKPVTSEKEIDMTSFRVVTVFDVSQTEGKDLPSIGVQELTGSVEQYQDFFAALEKTSPVPVAFEDIQTGARGYYHLVDQRIAIKDGMSEMQTLKTLIHEIAHAKLHAIDKDATQEELQNRPDRHTREVQAESVAYTVCQHFGLDTSDYSFGYVAGWSTGKEMTELRASLETIQTTSSGLISEIEGHFQVFQLERQVPGPDEYLTGETVKTPRGSFHLTDLTKEQMEAVGYGLHHNSDDHKYHIMGNGTRAFAIRNPDVPEQQGPEQDLAMGAAAFRLAGEGYLHIQECDYGYDYTIYDQKLHRVDGGLLNEPDLSLMEARKAILEYHLLEPSRIDQIPLHAFVRMRDAAEQAEMPPIQAKLQAAREKAAALTSKSQPKQKQERDCL